MFLPVKGVYAFRKRIEVPFLASSWREIGKTDEKRVVHGMPLSRWWGCGVCWGLGYDEKGGALLSIAAPSMPCEANRPLTSQA